MANAQLSPQRECNSIKSVVYLVTTVNRELYTVSCLIINVFLNTIDKTLIVFNPFTNSNNYNNTGDAIYCTLPAI